MEQLRSLVTHLRSHLAAKMELLYIYIYYDREVNLLLSFITTETFDRDLH